MRAPPFFFCICCLISTFESLKHNEQKKSREAGKVVLIVFFFFSFFLCVVTFDIRTRSVWNLTLSENRSSTCHTPMRKLFQTSGFFSRKVVVLHLQWSMGIKKGKFNRERVIPFIMLTDTVEKKPDVLSGSESLVWLLTWSCVCGWRPEECHYQRQPDGAALALAL